MELVAARSFNSLYIYLDIIWLIVFALILIRHKRYQAMLAGAVGSLIYFIADYGFFYLLLKTREISGADPFWFLLWFSISYGFTNLAWIWLLLDRDGHAVEWSTLNITGWMAVALLSQTYGASFQQIAVQRGTAAYHGAFALILAAGYIYLIIRNLRAEKGDRVNLLRLLAIGIGVHFSWEFVLLISNIRPTGVLPLIVNSLVETNMGLPYFYLIHRAISRRFTETLIRR
jgi:hypothetical protein